MLSDEGQAAIAADYLMPSRTDVKANRPLISDLSLLKYDVKSVYAKRKDTLATFAATFK
jgi:iron(III) transport system substrate-binding protein